MIEALYQRHFSRLAAVALGLVLLGASTVSSASAQATWPADFSAWHLPLPAGAWTISRGPCGAGPYQHQCGYYEDHCAIDLTSPLGGMEGVPVLAPMDGQVFFMGTRADSGRALLLRHPDGRVSALMHLSRIVVAPEQRVAQGEVVAYAGSTGSSSRAHLHFHVQPNTVERNCLPLDGLDEINLQKSTAVSHNLAWTSLTLVDPPSTLPLWLPQTLGAATTPRLPGGLILAPSTRVTLPVALRAAQRASLYYLGRRLQPALETPDLTTYSLDLTAPSTVGDYERAVVVRPAGTGSAAAATTLRLRLSVHLPADASAGNGIVLISPTFAGPANYSTLRAAPRLCWSEPAVAGTPPLRYRAMVVGPQPADSGWIAAGCWQAPALSPGTYYWKVFVRDGSGFMNRTNQRPFVFKIR
jgi:murein DD-endopeptidase MepM/ murein hydrolase activator NlpD